MTSGRPLPAGRLYLRLTAVMLGTLSVFGVTVITLHSLALGKATLPIRIDILRRLADAAVQDPSLVQPRRASGALPTSLVRGDGSLVAGDPLPRRFGTRRLRRPPGEYCDLGAPCYALRRVSVDGTPAMLVVRYAPSHEVHRPLAAAVVVSVVLWFGVSAVAGLVLLRTLRRADDARRRLLAGLAHDLGTPLTSIRGFAETRLSAPAGQDETRVWTVVYREALRMQRLVEDMLALTRIEAGRLDLVRRRFDLREAVTAAAERAGLAFGRQPVVEMPDAAAWTDADRDRIDQALANVVDNAYRHGGGQVTLSLTRTPAGLWRMAVGDEGPGLAWPPSGVGASAPSWTARFDMRHPLFEPFRRGDTAGGGSGLGLAIAREIVARHGGTIGAENDPAGHGCTVWMEIPAAPDAAP